LTAVVSRIFWTDFWRDLGDGGGSERRRAKISESRWGDRRVLNPRHLEPKRTTYGTFLEKNEGAEGQDGTENATLGPHFRTGAGNLSDVVRALREAIVASDRVRALALLDALFPLF
jgi:hypothetical protein